MSAPYMPLYIGDYLADTIHLTRSEHGAYLLLLMTMWKAGGALPAQDARLCRIALCTPSEWKEMKDCLMEFFYHRRGRIRSHRMDKELAKYESKICAAKKAAQASRRQKANKNNDKMSTVVDIRYPPKFNQPEPRDRTLPFKKGESSISGDASLASATKPRSHASPIERPLTPQTVAWLKKHEGFEA